MNTRRTKRMSSNLFVLICCLFVLVSCGGDDNKGQDDIKPPPFGSTDDESTGPICKVTCGMAAAEECPSESRELPAYEVPEGAWGINFAPLSDWDGDDVPDFVTVVGFGNLPGPHKVNQSISKLSGTAVVSVKSGATNAILRTWTFEPLSVDGGLPGDGLAVTPDVTGDGKEEIWIGNGLWNGALILLSSEGDDKTLYKGTMAPGVPESEFAGFGRTILAASGRVIVSAPRWSSGEAVVGAVLFYDVAVTFDEATQEHVATLSETSRFVAPEGEREIGQVLDWLGGDLNGNGSPDLVVSTTGALGSPHGPYILDGATGDYIASVPLPAGVTGQWWGFGHVVAGLGDINNDGWPDLAVTNPLERKVRLYKGVDGGVAELGVSFSGVYTDYGFGSIVRSIPDVTGDGQRNVLIYHKEGSVQLYSLSGELVRTFTNSDPGFGSVLDAIDINGDGIAEVVLGSEQGTPEGSLPANAGSGWECEGNVLTYVGAVALDNPAEGQIDCTAIGQVCKTLAGEPRCADEQLLEIKCIGNVLETTWQGVDGNSVSESLDCGAQGQFCQAGRCVAAAGTAVGSNLSNLVPLLWIHSLPGSCDESDLSLGGICNGHGTCLSVDGCQCDAGWSGACCDIPDGGGNCTIDADCNGGTCQNTICVCPDGMTGQTCDQAIDCIPGYYGAACDQVCPVLEGGCEDATKPTNQHLTSFGSGHVVAGGVDFDLDGTTDYVTGNPRWVSSHAKEGLACTLNTANPAAADLMCHQDGQADVLGCREQADGTGKCERVVGPEGQIIIWSGSDGAVIHTVTGVPGANLGTSLAIVGDTDGDQIPDIAAGAAAEESSDLPGSVYVVTGTGKIRYVREGSAPAERHGASVAGGFDLDGDTFADFVVGSPGYSLQFGSEVVNEGQGDESTAITGSAVGKIVIYSGRTGNAVRTIKGPADGGRLGTAVSVVPDLNDDGIADVIVGAPFDGTAADTAGAVYAYSGASGDELFVRYGPHADAEFGKAISGGPSGILVGSPGAAEKVFVLSGTNASGQIVDTIHNPGEYGGFGASVALVGDVDGDGIRDFAIGAPYAEVNGVEAAGKVFLFSGSDRRWLTEQGGAHQHGRFGASIYAGGDYNRDGRAEVIVASPGGTLDLDGDGTDDWTDTDDDGDGTADDLDDCPTGSTGPETDDGCALGDGLPGRADVIQSYAACLSGSVCGRGYCDDGPDGTGACLCQPGWTGSGTVCDTPQAAELEGCNGTPVRIDVLGAPLIEVWGAQPDTGDAMSVLGGGESCVPEPPVYYLKSSSPIYGWDAVSYCAALGGLPVRVDSAEEQAVVVQLGGSDAFWLGARRVSGTGNFAWADGFVFWTGGQSGGPVDGAYANWLPDFLNRLDPVSDWDRAVQPAPQNGSGWIPIAEKFPNRVVCEIPGPLDESVLNQAGGIWVKEESGNCQEPAPIVTCEETTQWYWTNPSDYRTWSDAMSQCQAQGGSLVASDSVEENDLVVAFLNNLNLQSDEAPAPAPCTHEIKMYDSYGDGWNGGRATVTVNGSTVLDQQTLGYGGGPATYTFQAATGDTIGVQYWPGGWSYECYYYVHSNTGSVLFDSGCHGSGCAPDSYKQGTASCGASAPLSIDVAWGGGNDIAQEGNWQWPDGTSFWSGTNYGTPVDGAYTHWSYGEPNNSGYAEDCLELQKSGYWNDRSCSNARRYVCEKTGGDKPTGENVYSVQRTEEVCVSVTPPASPQVEPDGDEVITTAVMCYCDGNQSGSDCAASCPSSSNQEECSGQGVCAVTAGSCTCDEGFSGTTCQDAPNPCVPNPCENGASCSLLDGEPTCTCSEGYFGELCQGTCPKGAGGKVESDATDLFAAPHNLSEGPPSALVIVGDLNGDQDGAGAEDLFVGFSQSGAGKIRAFGDGPGWRLEAFDVMPPDVSEAGVVNGSVTEFSQFGYSLATIDVNLDGVKEVLVGAPGSTITSNGGGNGAVALIDSATGTPLWTAVSEGHKNFGVAIAVGASSEGDAVIIVGYDAGVVVLDLQGNQLAAAPHPLASVFGVYAIHGTGVGDELANRFMVTVIDPNQDPSWGAYMRYRTEVSTGPGGTSVSYLPYLPGNATRWIKSMTNLGDINGDGYADFLNKASDLFYLSPNYDIGWHWMAGIDVTKLTEFGAKSFYMDGCSGCGTRYSIAIQEGQCGGDSLPIAHAFYWLDVDDHLEFVSGRGRQLVGAAPAQLPGDLEYEYVVTETKLHRITLETCKPVTCAANGTCSASDGTCACNDGYSGVACEVNVDDCGNLDCVHGYCQDGIQEAECICDEGWEGPNCSLASLGCAGDTTPLGVEPFFIDPAADYGQVGTVSFRNDSNVAFCLYAIDVAVQDYSEVDFQGNPEPLRATLHEANGALLTTSADLVDVPTGYSGWVRVLPEYNLPGTSCTLMQPGQHLAVWPNIRIQELSGGQVNAFVGTDMTMLLGPWDNKMEYDTVQPLVRIHYAPINGPGVPCKNAGECLDLGQGQTTCHGCPDGTYGADCGALCNGTSIDAGTGEITVNPFWLCGGAGTCNDGLDGDGTCLCQGNRTMSPDCTTGDHFCDAHPLTATSEEPPWVQSPVVPASDFLDYRPAGDGGLPALRKGGKMAQFTAGRSEVWKFTAPKDATYAVEIKQAAHIPDSNPSASAGGIWVVRDEVPFGEMCGNVDSSLDGDSLRWLTYPICPSSNVERDVSLTKIGDKVPSSAWWNNVTGSDYPSDGQPFPHYGPSGLEMGFADGLAALRGIRIYFVNNPSYAAVPTAAKLVKMVTKSVLGAGTDYDAPGPWQTYVTPMLEATFNAGRLAASFAPSLTNVYGAVINEVEADAEFSCLADVPAGSVFREAEEPSTVGYCFGVGETTLDCSSSNCPSAGKFLESATSWCGSEGNYVVYDIWVPKTGTYYLWTRYASINWGFYLYWDGNQKGYAPNTGSDINDFQWKYLSGFQATKGWHKLSIWRDSYLKAQIDAFLLTPQDSNALPMANLPDSEILPKSKEDFGEGPMFVSFDDATIDTYTESGTNHTVRFHNFGLEAGDYWVVMQGVDNTTDDKTKNYKMRVVQKNCTKSCGPDWACGDDGCGGKCGKSCTMTKTGDTFFGKKYHGDGCDNVIHECYEVAGTCEQALDMAWNSANTQATVSGTNADTTRVLNDDFAYDAGDCRGEEDSAGGQGGTDVVFRLVPKQSGWHKVWLTDVHTDLNAILWVTEYCPDYGSQDADNGCLAAADDFGSGDGEAVVEWLEKDVQYFVVVDSHSAGHTTSGKGTFTLSAKMCSSNPGEVDFSGCYSSTEVGE